MSESTPSPEAMSDELLDFYGFIFDDDIKQISPRIFEGDALKVSLKIDEFKQQHPQIPAGVMYKGFEDIVGMPWLSGYNPENDVFLVIQPGEQDIF
jgi:hypothetical protein